MSEQKISYRSVHHTSSKGLLYPKDHPLSSGPNRCKIHDTKEEDILTSSNLIEKGLVIDRLLESVINPDSKIKLDDMFIGDKKIFLDGRYKSIGLW